jgi:hypothetical protein
LEWRTGRFNTEIAEGTEITEPPGKITVEAARPQPCWGRGYVYATNYIEHYRSACRGCLQSVAAMYFLYFALALY